MFKKPAASAGTVSALRIGDLARLTGIGRATIEHYLRLGLLQPTALGDQGYRFFSAETVGRLEVIRIGRRAGFTLSELRAALTVADPAGLKQLFTTLPPARCRAELASRGAAIDV
jgi:DNA-binding transcriptional MerR regulator